MSRDSLAVHRVVAELLTQVQQRRSWESDPGAYAAARLSPDEAEVIARIDPQRLGAAAVHLDVRRVTTPPPPPRTAESAGRADGGTVSSAAEVEAVLGRWPLCERPLVGLGFWPDLYMRFEETGLVDVWEHRVDDYLEDVRLLEELANRGPVVMHSVGLSVGSPEGVRDLERLERVGRVLRAAGVEDFSDHLAFTQVGEISLGHFVPVWRVAETLEVVVANVNRVQDVLGIRLALENIAPIFDLGGEMTVAEFLNGVVSRTGCGVLLDITNLTLCEANEFCDAARELAILDLDAVVGVHLAGGEAVEGQHYDAHAFPVAKRDLRLLGELLPRMKHCQSVVIERDGRRGTISEVSEDLRRVHGVVE